MTTRFNRTATCYILSCFRDRKRERGRERKRKRREGERIHTTKNTVDK